MNEVYTQTAVAYKLPVENPSYEILADGRVAFRIQAPDASSVKLRTFDGEFPLVKDAQGLFMGTFDIGRGFIYLFVQVDGAEVIWPYLPIGYGCSRPINYIDVPTGEDYYEVKDVPHGTVEHLLFASKVTGRTETCLCYVPPMYDPAKHYPILYLQHGHSENEIGWVFQGKINLIADNLLAQGKMQPMIIAMCDGMLQIGGDYHPERFSEYLLTDVMPFVESRYPILRDREHRAMAGLSMGSMQTSVVTLSHPELFAWIGLFSGFLRVVMDKNNVNAHLDTLDDREAFLAGNRLFFRAMGTEDVFIERFYEDDKILEQKNIPTDRRMYPGKHVWQVWRRCAYDFLQLVFQPAK